jgi:hypothetical protein
MSGCHICMADPTRIQRRTARRHVFLPRSKLHSGYETGGVPLSMKV